MIFGFTIFIVSVLALAGMSFPVVRGVSSILAGNTKESVQDPTGEKKRTREASAEAAKIELTKARRKAGLGEVDNSDDEERRRRLFKQCALMTNLDKINKLSAMKPKNYMIIDSKNPYEIISNLTLPRDDEGKTIGPDVLFSLTSDEISALVPKARMFKVVYPVGSEGDPDQAVNIEIPFDDHTDPNNILNITNSRKGRAGGVGLKSFEWVSLGTNPANVNIFEANVTIYFQSIDQLFEKRRDYPDDVGVSPETRKKGVRFADLLVQQAKFDSYNEKETFNEDYFRLKAVVGWAQPTGNNWKTDKRKKKIRALLSKMTTNMSLSLVSHELDFREDGSLEVKIKYISAVEGIMNSPKANVLRGNPVYNSLRKKAEAALKSKREEYDKIYKEESLETPSKDSDDNSPAKTKIEKEIETLEKDAKTRKILTKNAKYSTFISELLINGKIKTLKVPKITIDHLSQTTLNSLSTGGYADILEYNRRRIKTAETNKSVASSDSTSPESKAALIKLLQTDSDVANRRLSEEQIEAEAERILELEKTRKAGGKESADALALDEDNRYSKEESAKRYAERLENLSETNTKEITEYIGEDGVVLDQGLCAADYYLVKFFRLGDLIDIVLEGLFLPENKELTTGTGFFDKKVKVVLGSFTYNDYGEEASGGRGKNREIIGDDGKSFVVKILEGKEKVMNLADIPISLEIFQRWFNQKVVSPGKEQYLFSNFIRDVVTDLIPMSLGQNCYEYAPKQKIRFVMTPITVNAKEGGFFSSDTSENPTPTRISQESIPVPSGLLPDESTTEDILYIYAETQSPYRLKGNYDEDSKKGIPHFYWGSSTGIVKSISFSREDQPFLQEANIQRGMDDTSVGVGKILREKYNAAINLFGNNLYWPGQKVYVNPSVQVLGKSSNAESRIRELGFGGYYDIVKTESSILPGVFETKLETKWQCFGDGKFLDGEPTDKAANFIKFQ